MYYSLEIVNVYFFTLLRYSRGMKKTIHDVAELSGVSIGTVSRVLNNRPGVKSSTRIKVQEAVDALAYIPESSARDLPRGGSKTIGIHLIQGGLHLAPFSVLFFRSVMRRVVQCGDRLLDIPSRPDGMPAAGADGLILMGAHQGDPRIDYLEKENIPHVLIGHDLGLSWVSPDDVDGGRQAGNYLTRIGHRQIIHVAGHLGFQSCRDRLAGLQEALSTFSPGLKPLAVLENMDTTLDAYRRIQAFIRDEPETFRKATAIFCETDEFAAGVKAALEDAGYTVPGDYSIVGYDDMPEIGNNFTTVHQDIELLASTALELLQDQFSGNPPKSRVLPVQLIVRNTTTPLRKD
jgi:LacI family transcriptional regulator